MGGQESGRLCSPWITAIVGVMLVLSLSVLLSPTSRGPCWHPDPLADPGPAAAESVAKEIREWLGTWIRRGEAWPSLGGAELASHLSQGYAHAWAGWVGRRLPGSPLPGTHIRSASEPVIARVYPCRVIVGFSDGSARVLGPRDLGLREHEAISAGRPSSHMLLRELDH